ncbi:hypothetical protein MMC17_002776 [Xylographa soralifera]|nr:hypothetical protein [Xylographa soralifera]
MNLANRTGNGKHMSTLSIDELDGLFKCFYASYQLYGLAVTFIKVSVLLFYRRVFPLAHLRMRINIIGGFVIAWLLANNLLAALQCMQVQKAWRLELPGQCINSLAFVLAIQVPNVVLDMIVLALPMHVVYKLHLPRSKKIGLAGIFLLGGGSVIIAIVRLGVLIVSLDQEDTSYSTPKTSLTVVEPAVELLSACLPTMASFLHLRTRLSELRSKVSLLFSSQRNPVSPNADSKRHFQNIKPTCKELHLYSNSELRPTITAASRYSVSQTDQIPLHAIMVRNDMAWEEERNVSNASSIKMLQAGEQMA